MSDYQARAIANDKSDPSNFPEDTGFRTCPECEGEFETDLDEIIDCDDHFRASLIDTQKLLDLAIAEKRALEARVKELESRVTYKEDLLREARLGLITLCESIGRESSDPEALQLPYLRRGADIR